jgi:phage gp29-like protein
LLAGDAGRPDGLNSEPAARAGVAPGRGLAAEELVRRSNFWRDNYNPLRGLTIARLLALFEQAERGAFAEIQLTLRKAEKRFPVLKGFMEKLLSSVEELDGRVRVKAQLPAGATPAMAERQRKFLQARYDLLRNFKASIAQLVLADVRGYAVLQKHRCPDGVNAGAVEELYWLEPWCWSRDGFYGDFYYNENSQLGVGLGNCQAILGEDCRLGSEALPRGDFVVREGESPLYEIALIAFVNWLMGRRDYAAFVEIFGLPNAAVIMPPNIPAGKELDYQAAAESVARGVSGALPHGADVKFPSALVRGESPFGSFCDAQERDVVLAGTAGHLTMLALPTGIGKGASEEHDDAWQKIALAKAMRINEALQRDFDGPELAAEFPSEPVCVQFALEVKDAVDVSALLDNVVKAAGAGLSVDAAEISERSGLTLKRAGAGEEDGGLKMEDGAGGLAAEVDKDIDKKVMSRRNRRPAGDSGRLRTRGIRQDAGATADLKSGNGISNSLNV